TADAKHEIKTVRIFILLSLQKVTPAVLTSYRCDTRLFRDALELSVCSQLLLLLITPMTASRFRICGHAGNGTRCAMIRGFKESSPVRSRRRSINWEQV